MSNKTNNINKFVLQYNKFGNEIQLLRKSFGNGVGFGNYPSSNGGGGDLPNVTGVIAWFDADTLRVSKDGSNRVSRVTDRSVTLDDMVQEIAVNQPTWFDAQINGKPAIQYKEEIFSTSTLNYLNHETYSPICDLKDALTMVTVFKWNINQNNTSDWHLIFGNTETSVANEGYAHFLKGTTDESRVYVGDDAVYTRLNIVKDQWYYMIYTWDKTLASPNQSQTISGLGTSTGNRTLSIPTSTEKLAIGGNHDPSLSVRGFGGMVAESILIDHKVDSTERAEIDAYILQKYGL